MKYALVADVRYCRCGCGEEVTPRASWRRGHRARGAALPPAPQLTCACGCGNMPKRGVWARGHGDRRQHGFNAGVWDPAVAKVFERLLRVYGVSREAYEAMVVFAGNRCQICRTTDRGKSRYGKMNAMWTVDHDHETGKVRGLLCKICNVALGQFGDDPARLQAALDYLETA